MKDYYTILGVPQNASKEEIKKAYRKLAHQYHPDRGGDEEKMKEINEAYQVLGNTEKRAQYDRFGRTFEGVGGGGREGFDFGSFWQDMRGESFDFGSFDFEDLFEDFFGVGQKFRKKEANRGRDIEIKIEINLKDTLESIQRNIDLDKMVSCQRCQGSGAEPNYELKECFSCRGSGEVQQIKKTIFGTFARYVVCPECQGEGRIPQRPCNVCKGEGRIKGEEEIEVSIPAGVDSGQTIKITGRGEAGRRKGRAGDLYIKIFVKKDKIFKRRGDDLFVEAPISFSCASLGDEVELSTLEGKKILLKIPSGTESGKVFRISSKGIPHFSGWGRGNLYARLLIKTPKKLTKKQKELLERLKEEGI